MNQDYNILWGTFNNRDNVIAQSSLEEKVNPIILKDDFFSRTDSSIFTSIASLLSDWSNETSWVFSALKSTSHFLPQSTDTEERGDWLKVTNNFVLIDDHIIIPSNLWKQVLYILHSAHQGINNMCSRAKQTVYWLGMNNDIRNIW